MNDRAARTAMSKAPRTLNQLLSVFTHIELEADPIIQDITLDSRKVGANGLFLAILGSVTDGREYIDQAIEAGAAAVIAELDAETDAESVELLNNIPVVRVHNLNEKVGVIASEFFGHPSESLKIVGVTGTNGKTTCAQLMQQLFKLLGEKAATIGTMGYGADLSSLTNTALTTPDAVACQRILRQFAEDGIERVCMEVSSHAISQSRHGSIKFEGAVFTNLTRDHLDYHGDMNTYATAKASLFASSQRQYAVINFCDAYGAGLILDSIPENVQTLGFAIEDSEFSLQQEQLLHSVFATQARYSAEGIQALITSPWGEAELHCALLGKFNLFNVLSAISVACAAGYPFGDVMTKLHLLKPIAGRMERVVCEGADITVCVDYAHTPDALEQALKAARLHTQHQLWVVFGCGGDRDSGKRPQMAAIAERFADVVVITSDNPRGEAPGIILDDIAEGFKLAPKAVDVDRRAAIQFALTEAKSGDFILLAGKGHERYQIVEGAKLPFDDRIVAHELLKERVSQNFVKPGAAI
ncbi:UDP-N-acetylmuramoyl-L-alanyl-D-glutamate--2,6-diaminopimelate ligase [Teredinibacter franksiae]|uniref:UDP-N-acetylmuramoyl-L-alanyl-D-glutamate--2, 6-diaminopimelate ligase n=1 Tax=Teredinibacter franksiae TaxID=2761453 RepID=UPI001623AE37|nr:UDP-N-acetylmuramoyl-L-alanyl-D-glutamate--2,6-diaminopimelate ligase [Teredinibacter franksiae]